jgi:hypothetical protein
MQVLENYIIRSQESFKYSHELRKKTGILDHVIEWCKDELVGDWRWHLVDLSSHQAPGRYIFYFDSDRDFFAFVLHWT